MRVYQYIGKVVILNLILIGGYSSVFAQAEKPDAALNPISIIGEISTGRERIIFNRLMFLLSERYKLVPQNKLEEARKEVEKRLAIGKCTEDYCVRQIQEILQVERLFSLMMIEEEGLTQLSLIMAREDEKLIKEVVCENCSVTALLDKMQILVGEMYEADIGGTVEYGSLLITSQPPGAEVYLNEKKIGVTPYRDDNIVVSEYSLSLRLPDYVPIESERIKVTKREKTEKHFELIRNLGALSVKTSPPGVEFKIFDENGKKVTQSTSPSKVELIPGKYLLELKKEGFEPLSLDAQIALNKTLKITEAQATLKPLGELAITADDAEPELVVTEEDSGNLVWQIAAISLTMAAAAMSYTTVDQYNSLDKENATLETEYQNATTQAELTRIGNEYTSNQDTMKGLEQSLTMYNGLIVLGLCWEAYLFFFSDSSKEESSTSHNSVKDNLSVSVRLFPDKNKFSPALNLSYGW